MAAGVPGAQRRKLAAILAADVAGYSRLVGADEDGTLARLRTLFRGAVQPMVAAHRGRVFKLMGDAFLAEFPSEVDAVLCAAALQEAAEARGAGEPDGRRIRLRVGVHLGGVVAEGGDLLGDGVNVAARLEGLAEPGGVVVSGAVAEAVRGRVPFALEDLGEQGLKNVGRPVRAFRVAPAAPAGPRPTPSGIGGVRPALPDRPSLAVLPFQNMGGDPEQDYFADGMVEEITTALSRVRWLFVIARNSAFTYKGRAVDARQVGRELGVRYVLEGSVRKAGGRVRITAQLIEAESNSHVWADRFDGTVEGIFELQDRVAEAVAGAVEPSLRAAEMERARRKPTGRLDAYDLYLRALAHFYALTPADNDAALDLLLRAAALDPRFVPAKALAAFCHIQRVAQGRAPPGDRGRGLRLAREALAAEPDDPEAIAWAAAAVGYLGFDREAARAAAEAALALNPNSAMVRLVAGWAECWMCRPGAAIGHLERARRLNPLGPEVPQIAACFALAHQIAGDYGAAVEAAREAVRRRPDWPVAHNLLVGSLAMAGRREEAAAAAKRFREAAPGAARVAARRARALLADPAFAERTIAALREAGLPE
jgi:adenylate cyclase